MATATVKGGFWSQYGATAAFSYSKGFARRDIAQRLGRKSNRALRELMLTLNGVVPGSMASETSKRVAASEELGGKRTIESETLVSRITTAADVTQINAELLSLSSRTYDPTPVANLDGNPLGTR